ncbi:MAG: ribonuclease P protein component, partial [Cyanobacteria bacterium J06554_3]
MALPQQNRLRSSRDFGRVYRKGKRAATKHLAVRALLSRQQSSQQFSKQTLSKQTPAAQKTFAKRKKNVKSVGGSPSALLLRSEQTSSEQTSSEHASGLKRELPGPRFGISISRKVHKRAVVRNRIKRQIKAIIRERYMAIAPEWQIVIVVRPPAV